MCNNSSKIIRFGKKLIHSLFCIIRVCSEKKESSIVLLGPKIVLYYYKHFSSFETCCYCKTCEAMENWKISCNIMDLAMKLGSVFIFLLNSTTLCRERSSAYNSWCTVQKLTVWAQVFALEIWHMPFNPILHIDNSATKIFPKAALASNWGQFVVSEKCPLNL